jgi:hypothetical protein
MTLTLAATSPAATVCDALLIGISPAKGKAVDVYAHGLSAAQSRKLAEAFASAGSPRRPESRPRPSSPWASASSAL